mmetsp:Transcript_6181/g.19502  ORF Transcript_6181/g.19502 Transcript_6181/m.19502 type:complete len:191 (+) Transcript_6181:212-784(+)
MFFLRVAVLLTLLERGHAFRAPAPLSTTTRPTRPSATGDRWYEGRDVKYPRGAANMPAGPPPETGGYGHEPELFAFWKSIASQPDVYEVKVGRPLGIVFEEIGTAARPQGVKVIEVQAGSNAAAVGGISVGDVLVGVSAVRYIGGEYLGKARPERDIFPADKMDFDTVVGAISSNEEPECDGVVLRLRKA